MVTFGANYLRGKARDRRARKQSRDSAIAGPPDSLRLTSARSKCDPGVSIVYLTPENALPVRVLGQHSQRDFTVNAARKLGGSCGGGPWRAGRNKRLQGWVLRPGPVVAIPAWAGAAWRPCARSIFSRCAGTFQGLADRALCPGLFVEH